MNAASSAVLGAVSSAASRAASSADLIADSNAAAPTVRAKIGEELFHPDVGDLAIEGIERVNPAGGPSPASSGAGLSRPNLWGNRWAISERVCATRACARRSPLHSVASSLAPWASWGTGGPMAICGTGDPMAIWGTGDPMAGASLGDVGIGLFFFEGDRHVALEGGQLPDHPKRTRPRQDLLLQPPLR